MTAKRGELILLFLSPELHFKPETPASLIEAKGKAKKQRKRIREDRTYWLVPAHMHCLN